MELVLMMPNCLHLCPASFDFQFIPKVTAINSHWILHQLYHHWHQLMTVSILTRLHCTWVFSRYSSFWLCLLFSTIWILCEWEIVFFVFCVVIWMLKVFRHLEISKGMHISSDCGLVDLLRCYFKTHCLWYQFSWK